MRQVSPVSRLWDGTTMKPQAVGSYRHIVLMVTITSAGAASTKTLVRGTAQQDVPAFGSAASASNFHTTIQVKNLSDGSTINGATGIPVDATGVFLVEINTNLLTWVGLDNTSVGAAVFNVDLVAASSGE